MSVVKGNSILAVLIAPLVVPLYFFAAGFSDGQRAAFNILFFGSILVFSYAATFALGIPAIAFLRRKGMLSIGSLVVTGAVLGALFIFVPLGWLSWLLNSSTAYSITDLGWGALLGAAVSFTYSVLSGIAFSNADH